MRRSLFIVVGLLGGCAVSTGNTVSGRDAGRDVGVRADAGLAQDAGTDASASDAGIDAGDDDADTDAGSDGGRDGGSDAGRDAATLTPPTIDGVVGSAEWSAATSGTSTTATIWTGDSLTALRAIAIGGTLYLAIEGQIEGNNAMIVYIDGDPGGAHGVADLTTLSDSVPTNPGLDDAVSAGFTQPTGFRGDVAWGTTVMSHIASGSDPTTGFRDIAANVADFAWLSGTQSACTASACEASVATSALGPGPAPRTIALFARITSPTGFMSPNQTLPMDVAASPRIVSAVLTIHE